jgi:hypothetical protein
VRRYRGRRNCRRTGSSAWTSGLGAGLIAATLVGIIWYSWETRRLVDSHESGAELDKDPGLFATTLKPEEQPEGAYPFLFGGFRLWLPNQNVGRTPALDVRVESGWNTTDHRLNLASLNQPIQDQVVVPTDTLHAYLGHIGFLTPHGADAELSVHVTYNVPLEGGVNCFSHSSTGAVADGATGRHGIDFGSRTGAIWVSWLRMMRACTGLEEADLTRRGFCRSATWFSFKTGPVVWSARCPRT